MKYYLVFGDGALLFSSADKEEAVKAADLNVRKGRAEACEVIEVEGNSVYCTD